MSRRLVALAAIALAFALQAPDANAGLFRGRTFVGAGGPTPVSGGSSSVVSGSEVSSYEVSGSEVSGSERVAPYSYYVAYPYPARTYSGYGSNDFVFTGKAYGRPYDPWTWPYLSAGPGGPLSRYYYAPVR